MVTNNSVNIESAGIVKYDGAGTFGAVTTTQYNVLVGDTANGIASVSPTSNTGYVLTSNGLSANPSFQVLPAGGITTLNGDSGSATGGTVTITATTSNAGKTVKFSGTSATLTLNLSDATKNNVGIGVNSLNATTTGGDYNTAVGCSAGEKLSSGSANTCMGWFALENITTGTNNTAIGRVALGQTGQTGVNWNVAIGDGAMGYVGANSINNVAVGGNTMAISNGAMTYNTTVGMNGLEQLVSGSYNATLGYNSGYALNGSESHNVLLNSVGTTGTSNSLHIGAATGTGTQQLNSAYICGIQGIVVTGAAVLVSTSDQLGVASSSRRFKKDIKDMADESSAILNLRPVTFLWDKDSAPGLKDASDERQFGVIAEEAAEVVPSLVNYTKDGEIVGFKYNELPAILLNELKKALKRIEALEEKLK